MRGTWSSRILNLFDDGFMIMFKKDRIKQMLDLRSTASHIMFDRDGQAPKRLRRERRRRRSSRSDTDEDDDEEDDEERMLVGLPRNGRNHASGTKWFRFRNAVHYKYNK